MRRPPHPVIGRIYICHRSYVFYLVYLWEGLGQRSGEEVSFLTASIEGAPQILQVYKLWSTSRVGGYARSIGAPPRRRSCRRCSRGSRRGARWRAACGGLSRGRPRGLAAPVRVEERGGIGGISRGRWMPGGSLCTSCHAGVDGGEDLLR